jgi:hypothetical protein
MNIDTSPTIEFEFTKQLIAQVDEKAYRNTATLRKDVRKDLKTISDNVKKDVKSAFDDVMTEIKSVSDEVMKQHEKLSKTFSDDKELCLAKIAELENDNRSLNDEIKLMKIEFNHLQIRINDLIEPQSTSLNRIATTKVYTTEKSLNTINKRISYYEIKNLVAIAIIIIVIILNNCGYWLN